MLRLFAAALTALLLAPGTLSAQVSDAVRAELAPTGTLRAGMNLELFKDRGADAVASLRPMLLDAIDTMPDARLLDGGFMVVNHGLGIPRGRPGAAKYLETFVQELNTSGFVARSIVRHEVEGLSAIQ